MFFNAWLQKHEAHKNFMACRNLLMSRVQRWKALSVLSGWKYQAHKYMRLRALEWSLRTRLVIREQLSLLRFWRERIVVSLLQHAEQGINALLG
jgi:hypothetical protein